MKKIWVLAVVGILVLFVGGVVVAGEVIIDETSRVCRNDYYFNMMALGGGDKITVQIHQPAEGLLGPPTVNVFILDSEQFHDYQEVVGGYGASFGKCYSVWDISLKTFTWTVPYTGTYYLVLDNTKSIRGGHFYSDMFVDIRVEKETPKPTPTPRQRAIEPIEYERSTPEEPGFLAISAIAGILIALYLIRRNK